MAKKNVKPSASLFQTIKLNVLNEFRIKSDRVSYFKGKPHKFD